MAYEETLRSVSLDADSSLALYTGPPGVPGSTAPNWGKQFRFVKVTGAHQVGLCTAAADLSVGVLQNKPQRTGEAATVATHGISMMQSGALLAAGVAVTSDSTGRAVAVAGAEVARGITVDACGAANELIPVLLRVN